MKKLVYILMTFIIAFSACDPNEEIYDELDKLQEPYSSSVEYTFTADDYATASEYAIDDAVTPEDTVKAENIEDMEAFNMYFTANDYVGKVLAELYPEYGKNSTAMVTYNNFLGGLDYLDNFGNATAYELVDADYDAMGTDAYEPGQYNNFSGSVSPEDYLPDFLLGKYPNAVADDMVAITYEYYEGGGVTNDYTDYYSFDGSAWSPIEGAYVLNADDYDSMGSPGAYNNFSSSDAPEDYLPTFLKIKFPYAQSGEAKVVVYKYYSGSVSTRAKEYHFDGSNWTEYDAIIEETNQFVHNGDEWLFDPTIEFTMASSDYQLIVDYVESNFGEDYIDSYGTADDYYGTSAYHNNFSIGESYWEVDAFDSWEKAVEEAIGMVLLPALYPNTDEQANGVDLYYNVIFGTYESGSNKDYLMRFDVTKAGPDPEFTLVEGPTLL